MPTAFVLAGGASLGAIEAGMVEALYERDIRADWFVGASAGALNAGFLASNAQEVASAHQLQEIWRGIRRRDVFPISPVTAILGLLGKRNHLVSPRGIRRLIRQRLTIDRIEATRTPLGIVVTDLLCGDERLFERGDAEDVLAASAAIPAVFPPVAIAGRPYVDGGVADNTPISRAVARGSDPIYVLPVSLSSEIEKAPCGALEIGVHTVMTMLNQRLHDEIEKYRDRVRLVVLPPPSPTAVLPTDFGQADALIAAGLDRAREALDSADPAGAPTDEALRCLTGADQRI